MVDRVGSALDQSSGIQEDDLVIVVRGNTLLRTTRTELMQAIYANITTGNMPYKDGSGVPADSGMQVLADGSILAPSNFGVEGASIDFADLVTLSEANSFLKIANNQFPDTTFFLVDARARRTTPSERPRAFHLTEAQNAFDLQADTSEILTANPLTFTYTAALNAQTNILTFTVESAMTNVRLRARYADGNQVAIKYFPSKAAWLAGEGGVDFSAGEHNVDLAGSPFRTFVGDQIEVEIQADTISLRGLSGVPRIQAQVQRGEFRDLAYLQDVIDMLTTAPSITSFSIVGLSGLVDAGTNVGGSQTFSYEVTNPNLVQGNLTLTVGDVVIASDIDPEGTSTTQVLPANTLAAGESETFVLSGISTSGVPFDSSVTLRARQQSETAYAFVVDTPAEAASFNIANATSIAVVPGSVFTHEFELSDGQYVGLLLPDDRSLVSARDTTIGAPVVFTEVADSRSINSQNYDFFHHVNNAGGSELYTFEIEFTVG